MPEEKSITDRIDDMGPMMRESRKIVDDLLEPKAWIFWTDFLICLSITYGCILFLFQIEEQAYPKGLPDAWSQLVPAFIYEIGSRPWVLLVYLVAGFGLHRLANFIHEVAHLNARNG